MDETDLQDDLAAHLEPPHEEAPPPLDPLDEDRANRMLFKLRRLARDRSQVQAVARAERDRVDAWERDRLEVIDREMTGTATTVEQWMRMHEARTKAVTKAFPNGTLRLRPARPKLDITDETKVGAYVMERVQTAIAKALDGENYRGRTLSSGEVLMLVVSTLQAEPFLRPKLELAKSELKAAAEEGPVTSEHEDIELRAAVIDGEAVPGMLFEKGKRKAFGMTLATAAGPDDDPSNDEQEEIDRGN